MIAVRALTSIFLMLGTLAFGSDAEAKATYTILPAGDVILSVNDSGAVTGNESNAGFLRTPDGSITTFHAPGDTFGTEAVSINADDVITGSYEDVNRVLHGYVRNADGSITTFDAPGAGTVSGQGTSAVGINQAGTVTGTYLDSSETEHSFVRTSDGNITDIKVQGAANTQAMGINDDGAIAGEYDHAGVTHGFVRAPGGKATSFDVPGDNIATFVQCINSKGAITGHYLDSTRVAHGYIRTADGTFTLFDAPGSGTSPFGINSNGVVVGAYFDNGQRRSLGFVRKTNGVFGKIRPPGATSGIGPAAINASGLIAGYFLVRVNKNEYEPYGFIRTP